MSILQKYIENHSYKKKYNTACNEIDMKDKDIQNRDVMISKLKELHRKQEEIWDTTLKDQEAEIIKLKKKIVKLKEDRKWKEKR